MNKMTYIGIGIFAIGCVTSILLLNVYPLLMSIGHVMIFVGIIFVGYGISCRKAGKCGSFRDIFKSSNDIDDIKQEKNDTNELDDVNVLAECVPQKNTKKTTSKTSKKDKNKVVKKSEDEIKPPLKNKNTVVTKEDIYVKDDAIVTKEDIYVKDDAIKNMRDDIIKEIERYPSNTYQVGSLFFKDAASCFPKNNYRNFDWDGAWFKINLETGRLFVEVGTYPNQFGACYEDEFSLNAKELNQIAKKYNLSKELQMFESEKDWEMLFDENLKAAVSSAYIKMKKREEEALNKEKEQYAIRIPREYAKISPNMDLIYVSIVLSQKFGTSSVCVNEENGQYIVKSKEYSHMRKKRIHYKRKLTAEEAVWLEKRVKKAIESLGKKWESLPGGDTMSLIIRRKKHREISFDCATPNVKYVDLINDIESIAHYGSFSVD